MTAIQSTSTSFPGAHRVTSDTRRVGPMAAVAFAAVVVGAFAGIGGAIALPSLTGADNAGRAYAEQLRQAAIRDALWEVSHPQPR